MIDHKRLIEIETPKDYIKFEGSKNNIFYFDNIHFILEENRILQQRRNQKYKIRKEQEIIKIEKNIVQNIDKFNFLYPEKIILFIESISLDILKVKIFLNLKINFDENKEALFFLKEKMNNMFLFYVFSYHKNLFISQLKNYKINENLLPKFVFQEFKNAVNLFYINFKNSQGYRYGIDKINNLLTKIDVDLNTNEILNLFFNPFSKSEIKISLESNNYILSEPEQNEDDLKNKILKIVFLQHKEGQKWVIKYFYKQQNCKNELIENKTKNTLPTNCKIKIYDKIIDNFIFLYDNKKINQIIFPEFMENIGLLPQIYIDNNGLPIKVQNQKIETHPFKDIKKLDNEKKIILSYTFNNVEDIGKLNKFLINNNIDFININEDFFKLLLINFKKISLYYDMHLKFKKFQEELYVFLKNKENLQE